MNHTTERETMTSEIDFSKLRGTDRQKLETLSFLRANASREIDRWERSGSTAKLQAAIDKHEAICYEISKYDTELDEAER